MTTIKEATQEWVGGFNAIPQGLINKAYGGENIDDLFEITKPSVGDTVWSNDLHGEYTIEEIDGDKVIFEDDGEVIETDIDDVYLEHDSLLPMWGTMWTFGDSADEWWLEDEENLQKMSELGFRIYESDELGYFFGIDSAGHDFYSAYWIPLYKARGLQWHDEEENEEK